MSTYLALGTTDVDGAIAIDDEVIAYLAESLGTMPTVDVDYCIVPTLLGGTTVDDDLGYLSHSLKVPKFQSFKSSNDQLKDAWWEGGNGFGWTYFGWHLRLRLDHILYSDELELVDVKVIDSDLSDHKPLMARFKFRE